MMIGGTTGAGAPVASARGGWLVDGLPREPRRWTELNVANDVGVFFSLVSFFTRVVPRQGVTWWRGLRIGGLPGEQPRLVEISKVSGVVIFFSLTTSYSSTCFVVVLPLLFRDYLLDLSLCLDLAPEIPLYRNIFLVI